MKSIYYLSLFLILLFVGSCGNNKRLVSSHHSTDIAIQVEPKLWKQQNDSVPFTLTISLPPYQFAKTSTLRLTPIIRTPRGEQALQSVYLRGSRVHSKQGIEIVKHKGYTDDFRYAIPYDPMMNNVQLIIKGIWTDKAKKQTEQQWLLYNSRIVAQLPSNVGKIDTINKKPFMPGEMQTVLTFQIGSDQIIAGQTYMKYFEENLRNVFAYKGAFLTKVIYSASCSPEGPMALNQKLVQQRLQMAIHYFDTTLNLKQYPGYDNPGVVEKKTIPENWQALYYLIEDSNLEDRYEIIKNLKSATTNQARNVILQRYIAKYPIFKNQFLKVLRHVWLTIEYMVPYHKVKPTVYPPIGPFSWPPVQGEEE